MSIRITLAAAAALTLGLVTAVSAHDYKVGELSIAHPWSRATAPNAAVGGGYMVIKNQGTTDDRLLGGSTPVAGEVQIHTMDMDGDIMRMRQLEDGLAIPAGATVALEPGAYHLMLLGLKETLAEGARVPLTLTFEKAGTVETELAVEGMGARAPAVAPAHGGHDGMDHGAHAK
ncbi:copper chaperone PCu(A)C [Aurantimonas sp. A2-1-M11]|uniref:copper chaperone PCu(A)C n=1 Tax=Aurantimonas sp. A2-1-M11 TaxID=3113712 RepID=UPI002F93E122